MFFIVVINVVIRIASFLIKSQNYEYFFLSIVEDILFKKKTTTLTTL